MSSLSDRAQQTLGADAENVCTILSRPSPRGTHGLHVTFGIIWLLTLMVQLAQRGLTAANERRLMCLSLFWHFLDIVWIGVFTFVYLMGMLR